MKRRIVVLSVLATVAAAVPVALAATAGNTATLTARSGSKVVINKSYSDTSRFSPGAVTIKSGGTLTVKNVGGAPHTISIVKRSQLPRTTKQVDQCKVCEDLAKAHEADPNSDAPPKKPIVDVGLPGLDQPGDSIFFMKTTKAKVSAKKGSNLYFVCAIHSWMQGKLQVK